MPAPLTISIVNPAVLRGERPNLLCYSSGLPVVDLDLIVGADDPRSVADDVLRRERDATLVAIELSDGVPVRVTAWKGLVGLYEVFYARLDNGGWYVTDHFHNAMAAIPRARRSMSDNALLQHYVCAKVYGRTTYARGVDRLSHGDRVDIDLATGKADVRIFSRHTSTAIDAPEAVHLDRLDGAFEDYLSPFRATPGVGVGFSGGVDSTLLATYTGRQATLLTLVPGCPEFDSETEYARGAARLLGRETTEIRLKESDYLEHLGRTIESIGMPVESYVLPVLARLYDHESSTFVSGEGADSAFASGRGLRRLASLLSGGIGRRSLHALEGDGTLGRRAKQIGRYAALFAEPALSPHGYAGTILNYHGDMSATVRMVGNSAIEALNVGFLQHVIDRVDLETVDDDGFAHQIELAQWRVVFSDLALPANHDAHAAGKLNVQPYLSWRILSEHLKVPARQRYYKGFTGKWMLKKLLTRRVSGYKVNKRKLPTGLPFERYFERGPLTGIWDRYEVPDVLPVELQSEVRTAATPLTWKAITHAIWRQRVTSNVGLEPHPSVLSESWPRPDPTA
jgi:asparagine synthetase B (glutamine-hydrolysing)